ncbi:Origin recognition complex subunit 2 [Chytridiales sp. JEL 0842]|nr:Origin recognition complex subunit 2 [Chytridiales sp. JEL 0842]
MLHGQDSTTMMSMDAVPGPAPPPLDTNMDIEMMPADHQHPQQLSITPSSKLLRKVVLWMLADHFLHSATLALSQNLLEQTHTHLLASLRSLHAVLLLVGDTSAQSLEEGERVTPLDEVRTRIKIAEVLSGFGGDIVDAEKQLQKALLLAQKLNDAEVYKFMIVDMQAFLLSKTQNFKAAKHTIKQALADAAQEGIPQWYYYFISRRADLHYEENEISSFYAILGMGVEEAGKRGDFDVMAALSIRKAIVALNRKEHEIVFECLQMLDTLSQLPPQQPKDTTTTGPEQPQPPKVTNPDLKNNYTLVRILYWCHFGDKKLARTELTAFHKSLESAAKQTPPSTTSKFLSTQKCNQGRISVKDDTDMTSALLWLPVDVLPPTQLHSLVFLVSGVVWKSVDASKCLSFLKEGLNSVQGSLERTIKECTSFGDVVKVKEWYLELEALCLHHLVEALILLGDLKAADETLVRLTEHLLKSPPLLEKYKPTLIMDSAFLYQSKGQFEEATRSYLGVASLCGEGDVELRILAGLCRVFLMLGLGGKQNVDLAAQLLEELQREILEDGKVGLKGKKKVNVGKLGNIKALSQLALGAQRMAGGEIKQTKVHLLDALKLAEPIGSNQLKMVSITMLGSMFLDTDVGQSLKMITTAQKLALKAGCVSFAGVCTSLMADLARRGGDVEKGFALDAEAAGYAKADQERLRQPNTGINKIRNSNLGRRGSSPFPDITAFPIRMASLKYYGLIPQPEVAVSNHPEAPNYSAYEEIEDELLEQQNAEKDLGNDGKNDANGAADDENDKDEDSQANGANGNGDDGDEDGEDDQQYPQSSSGYNSVFGQDSMKPFGNQFNPSAFAGYPTAPQSPFMPGFMQVPTESFEPMTGPGGLVGDPGATPATPAPPPGDDAAASAAAAAAAAHSYSQQQQQHQSASSHHPHNPIFRAALSSHPYLSPATQQMMNNYMAAHAALQQMQQGLDRAESPTSDGERERVKMYKCPRPGCTKIYKNANGLKYHLEKGSCETDTITFVDPSAVAGFQASEESAPTPAIASPANGLLDNDLRVVHRPFACRVSGCGKRYQNLNGLKYHSKVTHPNLDFKNDKPNCLSETATMVVTTPNRDRDVRVTRSALSSRTDASANILKRQQQQSPMASKTPTSARTRNIISSLTEDIKSPNASSLTPIDSMAGARFLHHTGAAAQSTHELDLLDLKEDRARVHLERMQEDKMEMVSDALAKLDKENADEDEQDPTDPFLELRGQQVFSFEKIAVRETRKIRKLESKEDAEVTPKKKAKLGDGCHTPTTPSSRRGRGRPPNSVTNTPNSASRSQLESDLNTPVHRNGRKGDSDNAEPEGYSMRLRPRPGTRTPDVKFANRRQIASVVEVNNSESEEEDSEDENEDEEVEEDEEVDGRSKLVLDHQKQEEIKAAHAASHSLIDNVEEDESAGIDNYFSLKKSNLKTSDNTLSKLPTLSHQDYVDALARAPVKHLPHKTLLASLSAMNFAQWSFELSQGFNLLLYGYGSKENIINKFVQERCWSSPVFTLKGYLPKLNPIKDLLSKIITTLVKRDGVKGMGSLPNQVAAIANYFASDDREYDRMYIVIHNIDGPNLRNEKAQSLLSTLVSTSPPGSIRLIASIDHINAPLLWDRAMADRYRWLWKDATSFEPYTKETEYASVMMVQSNQKANAEGAKHVLASLNGNAQKMFRVLAEYQIEASRSEGGGGRSSKKKRVDDGEERGAGGGSDSEGEEAEEIFSAVKNGLSYNTFYHMCVENLIATNMEVFKTQLGEFRDHKIIISKKASDGEEVLYIPFNSETLQELVLFLFSK